MKSVTFLIFVSIFTGCYQADKKCLLQWKGMHDIDTNNISPAYKKLITERNWLTLKLNMDESGTFSFNSTDSDIKQCEGKWYSKYNDELGCIIYFKQNNIGSYGSFLNLNIVGSTKDGVLIKKGWVKKGQQIGLSGATGQVIQPHLHFSVKAQLNYKMDAFRKTKFQTEDGIIFLKQGNTYTNPL